MSQDVVDLIKAMLAIFFVFALATLTMLYILVGYRLFGGNLPVIGDLPGYQAGAAVPLFTDTRMLILLGATLVMASGIALVFTSATVDMAILIFAKAMTLITTAMFAVIGGQWAYLRLSANTDLALPGINRLGIALIVFFLMASILRLATFRAWGIGRFLAAIAMVLLAPILLVSL